MTVQHETPGVVGEPDGDLDVIHRTELHRVLPACVVGAWCGAIPRHHLERVEVHVHRVVQIGAEPPDLQLSRRIAASARCGLNGLPLISQPCPSPSRPRLNRQSRVRTARAGSGFSNLASTCGTALSSRTRLVTRNFMTTAVEPLPSPLWTINSAPGDRPEKSATSNLSPELSGVRLCP